MQYISTLNPESASDKLLDSDGDGATNIEEFAFRGNPTDDQDIGYSGAYNFEISNTNMIITQVIPLRSNWDDLGLIMDTYWKSNLNQTIWSPTSITALGTNLNQYAENIHSQTNQIYLIEDSDTVFLKTFVR